MHSTRGQWSVKYGLRLGVQVGFEMGTGEKVKEESECRLPVLDSWNSESVLNEWANVTYCVRTELPQYIQGCSMLAAARDGVLKCTKVGIHIIWQMNHEVS